MYILQFDGQFQENNNELPNLSPAGLMGYGWSVYKENHQIARGWGAFAQGKKAASNIAEYLALIEGLESLLDMQANYEEVEIRGDARSVIDQMAGHASVHSQPTMHFYQQARRLANRFEKLNWTWIPRRSNKSADYLSRKAIRQLYNTPGAYQKAIASIVPGLTKIMPVFDLRIYQPYPI